MPLMLKISYSLTCYCRALKWHIKRRRRMAESVKNYFHLYHLSRYGSLDVMFPSDMHKQTEIWGENGHFNIRFDNIQYKEGICQCLKIYFHMFMQPRALLAIHNREENHQSIQIPVSSLHGKYLPINPIILLYHALNAIYLPSSNTLPVYC